MVLKKKFNLIKLKTACSTEVRIRPRGNSEYPFTLSLKRHKTFSPFKRIVDDFISSLEQI